MKPLSNYVVTHRKRLGLTQGDLTFLLAYRSRATISALERGIVPSLLRTLIRLQTLFSIPLHEIFPGECELARVHIGKHLARLQRLRRAKRRGGGLRQLFAK